MTPINVIEEITKPITLTFRLFGNIFSGLLMIIGDRHPAPGVSAHGSDW